MLVPVLLFAVGLLCLIKGGDWFVDGATGLARRFQERQGALAVICDCALNIQEQNAQKGQVPEIDENAAVILEKAEEIAGES